MSNECEVTQKDELIKELREDNELKNQWIAELESKVNDLEYCIAEQDIEVGQLQDQLEEYREFKRALKKFYQGFEN